MRGEVFWRARGSRNHHILRLIIDISSGNSDQKDGRPCFFDEYCHVSFGNENRSLAAAEARKRVQRACGCEDIQDAGSPHWILESLRLGELEGE